MAHKTKINGTAYSIKGGKTKVNGTAYSIKKGMTKVNGTGYSIKFSKPVTVTKLASTNTSGYFKLTNVTTNTVLNNQSNSAGTFNCNTGEIIRVSGYVSSTSGTVRVYLNGNLVLSKNGGSGTEGVNYNYWADYDYELTQNIEISFSRSSRAVQIRIVEKG